MAEPRSSRLRAPLLALALGAVAPLAAQEYSHDGNHWYEIEVLVFARDYRPGPGQEITAPDLIQATYLPRPRPLQSTFESLQVDFPGEGPLSSDDPVSGGGLFAAMPELPRMGPLHSPAVRDAFRITDVARDPFIDITGHAVRFTPLLRNLERDGSYRLLWHRTWRQPMQGTTQTPALLVAGGGAYGEHSELEGSLRLRDESGRVMLDLSVWLNRFVPGTIARDDVENTWRIPPSPASQPEGGRPLATVRETGLLNMEADWSLEEVWQLRQTRELGANQLYYLDHPVLGVLIQARPYVLPQPEVADDEVDF